MEVCAAAITALAQVAIGGDLNPPVGPVAPTHKTLTEVEPRIAINAVNTPGDASALFKITQPGSYYLAGNLAGEPGKVGIVIAADGVVIDLMGYTMEGGAAATKGIVTSGVRNNITVRSGVVTGFTNGGVDLINGGTGVNFLVEGVHARNNGTGTGLRCGAAGIIRFCSADANSVGIQTGVNAVVDSCSATNNSSSGIVTSSGTSVTRCVSSYNQDTGISVGEGSSVLECSATFNQGDGFVLSIGSFMRASTAYQNNGRGVHALSGVNVSGLSANFNTLSGIEAADTCVIENGVFRGNAGSGISVAAACTIRGNMCLGNSAGIDVGAGCLVADNVCVQNVGPGLRATGSSNRLEGNFAYGQTIGIHATGTGNMIVRNTCSLNSINWSIAPGNVCLVVTASTGGLIIGNAGGVAPGSTDPNVNFSY